MDRLDTDKPSIVESLNCFLKYAKNLKNTLYILIVQAFIYKLRIRNEKNYIMLHY